MGRTLQIVTEKEELVCFVQKTTKALIMEVRATGRRAAADSNLLPLLMREEVCRISSTIHVHNTGKLYNRYYCTPRPPSSVDTLAVPSSTPAERNWWQHLQHACMCNAESHQYCSGQPRMA